MAGEAGRAETGRVARTKASEEIVLTRPGMGAPGGRREGGGRLDVLVDEYVKCVLERVC